jgi:hypothetical protein
MKGIRMSLKKYNFVLEEGLGFDLEEIRYFTNQFSLTPFSALSGADIYKAVCMLNMMHKVLVDIECFGEVPACYENKKSLIPLKHDRVFKFIHEFYGWELIGKDEPFAYFIDQYGEEWDNKIIDVLNQYPDGYFSSHGTYTEGWNKNANN